MLSPALMLWETLPGNTFCFLVPVEIRYSVRSKKRGFGMKGIVKAAAIILLALGLLSCNKASGHTADINVMKNEDFYFEFVLMAEADGDTEQKAEFARCDGTYYLRLDDSVLLHSKHERYAIDNEKKVYWEDDTVDLNFEFVDSLFDSLETVKTTANEDGTLTVECKNKLGKRILLTYKDNSLSQIDLYLYSAEFSTKCSIIEFSTDIPDSVMFSVPEGYTKTDGHVQ